MNTAALLAAAVEMAVQNNGHDIAMKALSDAVSDGSYEDMVVALNGYGPDAGNNMSHALAVRHARWQIDAIKDTLTMLMDERFSDGVTSLSMYLDT
jgi:pyruvate/oxaloacetate carboxyltransferase